ncbi:MAG: hypothetical protein M1839_002110 [Geoglossum umbratile]|nr:MAG: hypothetical protein M1839_002110 [Geoglossum umbratile]
MPKEELGVVLIAEVQEEGLLKYRGGEELFGSVECGRVEVEKRELVEKQKEERGRIVTVEGHSAGLQRRRYADQVQADGSQKEYKRKEVKV